MWCLLNNTWLRLFFVFFNHWHQILITLIQSRCVFYNSPGAWDECRLIWTQNVYTHVSKHLLERDSDVSLPTSVISFGHISTYLLGKKGVFHRKPYLATVVFMFLSSFVEWPETVFKIPNNYQWLKMRFSYLPLSLLCDYHWRQW